MSSDGRPTIHFGPFEVTNQVFLTTPHSFALVNLKPLLPGHVLVCPHRQHQRLTDLSPPELTDLFTTVQRVQRMLARHFFPGAPAAPYTSPADPSPSPADPPADPPSTGAFNIALQDGPSAGQTVPHAHVHVLPRIPGRSAHDAAATGAADAVYERMAGAAGNVGGAQWDAAAAAALGRARPVPGGGEFPRVEDCEREARGAGEMEAEAAVFRAVLEEMEREEGGGGG